MPRRVPLLSITVLITSGAVCASRAVAYIRGRLASSGGRTLKVCWATLVRAMEMDSYCTRDGWRMGRSFVLFFFLFFFFFLFLSGVDWILVAECHWEEWGSFVRLFPL